MKKIILSADSTCDLGLELQQKLEVQFYPYHIILEGNDYLDNVTILPEDIYRSYREHKQLPHTAAINVSEYMDYFKQFTDQGYEVIHFNLGSALSSSYQNAMLAAQSLPGVYPIDSCSLSTGIALQILDAAKMIEEGACAETIVQTITANRQLYHASFILNTLEFLHAGGRCSSLTALGANLLNLKPCIEVNNTNGAMTVGKKYRGNLTNVLVHYIKDKLSQYSDINTTHIFITHSGIEERYLTLAKNTIEEQMAFEHIYITRASCTISSHCGPNTIGILFKTQTNQK